MTDKEEILKAIEGIRQQQSAEHSEQMAGIRSLKDFAAWWRSVWQRVGRGTWSGDSK